MKHSKKLWREWVSGVSLSVWLLLFSSGAGAQDVQVTSLADDGPGSLRQALLDAGTGSTITFAAGLSGRAIQLTSGELRLERNVTVDASGLAAGLRLDGARAHRVMSVGSNAVVVLNGLTITNGFLTASNTATWGGGIDNRGRLSLQRCTLTGNTCQGAPTSLTLGGAVVSFGPLTIGECTFAGNVARGSERGGQAWGGAIYSAAALSVDRATFFGNSARAGGADFDRAYGGAIATGGPLVLNQCTLSGNSVVGGAGRSGEVGGGALYTPVVGGVSVNQCTIAGNSAEPGRGADSRSRGGGINGRTVLLFNSIVAGNAAADGPNLSLSFVTETGTNLVSGDPGLSALAFYGGPTRTMPPLPGSPALNGGSDSATNQFSTDQRGLPRRVGAGVDIGAVEAELQVASGPTGIVLPARVLVAIGSNLTMSVSPGGTPPLRYQWYFNKKSLPGETNAALVVTNVQTKNAGSYLVKVANAFGAATSGVAKVEAYLPPVIKVAPRPVTVLAGRRLTLTARATGAAPLTYQWRRSGVAIPGATNVILTIPVAMPVDAGNYTVTARNPVADATSSEAAVAVPPLQIPTPPKELTVVAGGVAKFSVRALSVFPLTYQWRQDGVDVPGATNSTLTIANAQPVNRGSYTVVVSNRAGDVPSAAANLGVTVLPVRITLQPRGVSVKAGTRVTFKVAATGTLPMTYQWAVGGLDIAGATNATLVLANVQATNAGVYTVVVRNVETSATSANAVLEVRGTSAAVAGDGGGGSMPALRLQAAWKAGGTLQLEILAPAGLDVILEASDDLVVWSEIGVVAGAGETEPVPFVDPDTARHSHRYYRLRTSSSR